MFFDRPRPWAMVFSLCLTGLLPSIAASLLADDMNNHPRPTLAVRSCEDFEVTGLGDHDAWNKAEWTSLNQRGTDPHKYTARFKMLYSQQGLYVLFDGTDTQLTATLEDNFLDLWTEDVYECFFWPDESIPLYLEYEISPLGYELPILVPKTGGKFMAWRPWRYEEEPRIKKRVSATGGPNKSMARVTGWRAEIFIPYEFLKPMQNVPPESGDHWRANFYRIDYDDQQTTQWDWSRVGPSFHQIENFGTLVFE